MGRKARGKRLKGQQEVRPSRRRQRRRLLVGVALAVLVVGGGVATWLWNGARAAPEPAPRFNLPASTGRVIALDEFLGKQEVVLIFYMVAT